MRTGDQIIIGTDASTTRLGGWLAVNDVVREYFSEPITANDEGILGRSIGDFKGQQVFEFLAVLVALRLWIADRKHLNLKLVGDNIGALTLALKLRPKCPKIAILSRECALVLADLSFPIMEHTPGVAHILADRLSRIEDEDDKSVQTHPALYKAKRVYPPARDHSWYKTLAKFRG